MTRMGAATTAILLAGTMVSTAAAGTIEVRPGQSIEAAINRAQSGDTVAVRAGTYHETIYAKPNGVKIVSADGKGAAHIISGGTPLFIQGGSGNQIIGFRLTAGAGGNGIQVGGTPGDYASGYVIADNVIERAGEDGVKVHQASNFTIEGNVIHRSGMKPGNSNSDGGFDFVAVQNSSLRGNEVLHSAGDTCAMIKGGSSGNTITDNRFTGCKDSIHVGGMTIDKYAADRREAFNNTITGNQLCGRNAVYMFDGERERRDNSISGNSCSGASVGPSMAGGITSVSYTPLDAEKLIRDIATMRNNGLNDSAIRYVLGLDGIKVPDEVLNGDKTVQQAIEDGTMKQDAAPSSWSPPALQPTPTPDLTPQGSSASGWRPDTVIPTLESMRRAIMTTTTPPNC